MTEIFLYMVLPFLLLLIFGMPIAFALGIASFIFIFFSQTPIPALVVATEMYSGIDQFALLALPLFVFAGELLNRTKVTEMLVNISDVLVGWLKGGLGHINIVASMFFAGISGSALADTASIGAVIIPPMKKQGYSPAYSAAVTAASSVIGPVIPPSIPMIIVGGVLAISIGGLFAAGMIPGILIGFSLMIVNHIISLKRGYGAYNKFPGIRKAAFVFLKGTPALLAPLILLGGILSGIFTPTEAGAVAVSYCLILGFVLYRSLSLKDLLTSMVSSGKVTASALFIVATAVVFSRILAYYKVPEAILNLLLTISANKIVALLIINCFLIVMGMVMDAIANMIILGPILMPVCVTGLGMDPLQFGVMLVVNLLVGLITPPLGMCLFIASPIAKAEYEKVALAVTPFLVAELCVLLIVIFIPDSTLYMPKLLGFAR
jgi:tripartite ATP-independent transporter DctM subunit